MHEATQQLMKDVADKTCQGAGIDKYLVVNNMLVLFYNNDKIIKVVKPLTDIILMPFKDINYTSVSGTVVALKANIITAKNIPWFEYQDYSEEELLKIISNLRMFLED